MHPLYMLEWHWEVLTVQVISMVCSKYAGKVICNGDKKQRRMTHNIMNLLVQDFCGYFRKHQPPPIPHLSRTLRPIFAYFFDTVILPIYDQDYTYKEIMHSPTQRPWAHQSWCGREGEHQPIYSLLHLQPLWQNTKVLWEEASVRSPTQIEWLQHAYCPTKALQRISTECDGPPTEGISECQHWYIVMGAWKVWLEHAYTSQGVLYTPPHTPVGLQMDSRWVSGLRMDSTYHTTKAMYFMIIHPEPIWSLHRLCLDSTRFQMVYSLKGSNWSTKFKCS